MTSLVLTSFNKKPFNKDLFDGLVSFNYLLTQKLPRKAKVALVADRCSQYKKLLKTLKVAQKLPSTSYLCLLISTYKNITLHYAPQLSFIMECVTVFLSRWKW